MTASRRKTTVYSFVRLIAVVCICVLHGYKPAYAQNTTCASPRVRRAWGTLSSSEKQLYLDAVMAAMSSGNHALFLGIHSDTVSGNEGHRTCGMLYWHRRFILAYENMLWSLETWFACLTIPYWDYYTDYVKKATSLCNTFENCSMILSEFGGSAGPASTKSIGGIALTGNCVDGSQVSPSLNLTTNFSLSNFCQSSSVSGTDCWKCVPRDNWAAKVFPSGFSLASLARLISVVTAPTQPFSNFAQNLHCGVHNTIHNTAGSTMATLWTSADPIFYNHHSTIDLIHQMWYDCQVKRTMTEYEKRNSIYAFQQCGLTTADVCPTVNATITQYLTITNSTGSFRVRADDHPLLGPFFSPLPTEYWQYVSGRDLGAYSYTYKEDSLLSPFTQENIPLNCPANSTLGSGSRRLSDKSASVSVEAVLDLYDSLYPAAKATVESSNLTPTEIADWTLEQMELMHCSWYGLENRIEDYSNFYRTNMRIPADKHPLCYSYMKDLEAGGKSIMLDDWEDTFELRLDTRDKVAANTIAAFLPGTVNPPVLASGDAEAGIA
ncbi:hypothetical protein FI667_g10925, partial [Globisporangium splendens]